MLIILLHFNKVLNAGLFLLIEHFDIVVLLLSLWYRI